MKFSQNKDHLTADVSESSESLECFTTNFEDDSSSIFGINQEQFGEGRGLVINNFKPTFKHSIGCSYLDVTCCK